MAGRDDFTPGMKEAPFYRDGMSITEYDVEREHWLKHDTPKKMARYAPLWKKEVYKDGSDTMSRMQKGHI